MPPARASTSPNPSLQLDPRRHVASNYQSSYCSNSARVFSSEDDPWAPLGSPSTGFIQTCANSYPDANTWAPSCSLPVHALPETFNDWWDLCIRLTLSAFSPFVSLPGGPGLLDSSSFVVHVGDAQPWRASQKIC
jgi:hypothetical protein